MNFKSVSDVELVSKTQALMAEERRITLEVLHYLREIEARRLFLARGFEQNAKGIGIIGDGVGNVVVNQTDVNFAQGDGVFLNNLTGTVTMLGTNINNVGNTNTVLFPAAAVPRITAPLKSSVANSSSPASSWF